MNRRQLLQILGVASVSCVANRRLWPQARAAFAGDAPFPQYVDVAGHAGLTARTVLHGDPSNDFLLATTGGGVALIDYDNDGWLDIFVLNSWGLHGFAEAEAPTNHLYHNNRDETFTDVTEKAGLIHHGWSQGVCVGDYDNDGYLDLFVTQYGKNLLYHNNQDGTFTEVTSHSGLAASPDAWNSGAAFLDYDRDGHLDLFVSHYVDYQYGLALYGSNPNLEETQSPVLYGVAGLKGTFNTLYHNNGDGTFTDVSAKAGILKARPTYGFTPLVADFDNDGWPDIYVANDSTPSLLFKNNHDGTFSEMGLLAGVAYNSNGHTQAGMGVDAGDYDCDGRLDIVKTNFSDEPPALFHNDGQGYFTDVTVQAGLAGAVKDVKWGTAFFDFDNDGFQDIVIVTGPIYPPGVNNHHPMDPESGRSLLFRNLRSGRFEDISAESGVAFTGSRCGRGLAVGDLFHTGQLDLVVNNINDRPSLLRNQRPTSNSWMLIRLVGAKTNKSAIGSRVIVSTGALRSMQEVRSGGSFCSQNDLRLHFGLGPNVRSARVEVRWLSGNTQVLEGVPANHLVTIEEGRGIVARESW
ncbi:MAG: CRTAC1 family protein [Acidobacteria bacterium]|nr:MAG: CRTAC1 family protein [Acidobacteriota bacterium]